MKPIFLIGFMCSGKTTLGRALAEASQLRFFDLDDEISRAAGMSVKEIFATMGENAFRKIEADTLRRFASLTDAVVACGGGTPCQPGAMELMNTHGTTVRLLPSRERLINRLMDGRDKRPLIASVQTPAEMLELVDRLQAQREQHYAKAAYTFDSSLLENPDEIAQTVNQFLGRFVDGRSH